MTLTETTEFNPQDFLSYQMSSEEAEGRTALAPEGPYDDCEISDLQVYPPSEKYPKPGVKAILRFIFDCPNYDGTLEKRINFKAPLSRRSALWKLMNAVFGEAGMKSHTPEDLVNKKVNIYVSHEWTDGPSPVKYADFKYSLNKD